MTRERSRFPTCRSLQSCVDCRCPLELTSVRPASWMHPLYGGEGPDRLKVASHPIRLGRASVSLAERVPEVPRVERLKARSQRKLDTNSTSGGQRRRGPG
jgi:hypothetical protein